MMVWWHVMTIPHLSRALIMAHLKHWSKCMIGLEAQIMLGSDMAWRSLFSLQLLGQHRQPGTTAPNASLSSNDADFGRSRQFRQFRLHSVHCPNPDDLVVPSGIYLPGCWKMICRMWRSEIRPMGSGMVMCLMCQDAGRARRNDCSRSKSIAKNQKLAIKSLGGDLPWAKVHWRCSYLDLFGNVASSASKVRILRRL